MGEIKKMENKNEKIKRIKNLFWNSKIISTITFISFIIALLFSIVSFIYFLVRRDLLLIELWINQSTEEFIAYTGILATCAISLLLYFISNQSLNLNKKIYELQKKDIISRTTELKEKQFEIDSKFSETLLTIKTLKQKLQGISNNLIKIEDCHKNLWKTINNLKKNNKLSDEELLTLKKVDAIKIFNSDNYIFFSEIDNTSRIGLLSKEAEKEFNDRLLSIFDIIFEIKETEEETQLKLNSIKNLTNDFSVRVGPIIDIHIDENLISFVDNFFVKDRYNDYSLNDLFLN